VGSRPENENLAQGEETWERDSIVATCPTRPNEQDSTRTIRGHGPRSERGPSWSWIGEKWPAARLWFVEMATDGRAEAAIANLNGKDFQGRTLTVNEARERLRGRRRWSWRLWRPAAAAVAVVAAWAAWLVRTRGRHGGTIIDPTSYGRFAAGARCRTIPAEAIYPQRRSLEKAQESARSSASNGQKEKAERLLQRQPSMREKRGALEPVRRSPDISRDCAGPHPPPGENRTRDWNPAAPCVAVRRESLISLRFQFCRRRPQSGGQRGCAQGFARLMNTCAGPSVG